MNDKIIIMIDLARLEYDTVQVIYIFFWSKDLVFGEITKQFNNNVTGILTMIWIWI